MGHLWLLSQESVSNILQQQQGIIILKKNVFVNSVYKFFLAGIAIMLQTMSANTRYPQWSKQCLQNHIQRFHLDSMLAFQPKKILNGRESKLKVSSIILLLKRNLKVVIVRSSNAANYFWWLQEAVLKVVKDIKAIPPNGQERGKARKSGRTKKERKITH